MQLTHTLIIALTTALITISGLFFATDRRNKAEIVKLASELNIARQNEKSCSSAVAVQNEAIERIRVDTVFLNKEVNTVVAKYAVIRDTVTQILKEDSSHENQIRVMDNLLRNFFDK
jgi:bisphosphoglycerate-independent phosphoglycerate mutase (AlkP superfamily)